MHAMSNLQRNGENRGAFGRENRDDFGRVSSRLQIGEQHSSSSSTDAFERVSSSLQIGEQHSSLLFFIVGNICSADWQSDGCV